MYSYSDTFSEKTTRPQDNRFYCPMDFRNRNNIVRFVKTFCMDELETRQVHFILKKDHILVVNQITTPSDVCQERLMFLDSVVKLSTAVLQKGRSEFIMFSWMF